MKINKKVLLILLVISLTNIQSAYFGFGMLKKSGNRNHNSHTLKNNSNANANTNTQSKGVNTSYYAVSTSITKSHSVTTKTSSTSSSSVTRGGDIPDFSIYYDGWVKYLHFTDGTKKPKAFFKNTRYAPETRAKFNGPEKDKNGVSNRIPSETHFFITVYKDTINFFNSREDGTVANMIDSCSIENVDIIPDTGIRTGGIKDYGKFDEGFCFRINTKVPNEYFKQSMENLTPTKYLAKNWIICTDLQAAKDTLMLMLIRLKLKNQHSKNIYLEYEKSSTYKTNNTPKIPDGKVGSIFEGGNSKVDCSMIIIHAWTPCTLACGGGKSYLQLMKIPAKQGGKECENTEAIRQRECNMQACPTVSNMKAITEGTKTTTSVMKSATVKMMSISSRPLRYDKCHLKEGDALIEKNDASTKDFTVKPMIPIRIVMTEKTFAAYQDDTLKSKIVDYNLSQAVMIKKSDGNCFVIQNNERNDKFCMLDSGKGDFLEEWYYDFNLFKNQCQTKRAKSSLIFSEEKKLEDEFKKKVAGVQASMVEEKASMIKKRVEQTETRKLVSKVDKVRKVSLTAIEKEQRLEDLLEKEESSREEDETSTFTKQIESEKKKEECLMKAIKEKEIENQYNIAKASAERAVEKITTETKKQITKQRENITKKIIEMRNRQKRKKAQLRSEVMTIRTQIASRLQTINKMGSTTTCISSMKGESNREKYCSEHFADNYIKFADCINKDSFCYVCCESEFGDLHVVNRDSCYTSCDNAAKTN